MSNHRPATAISTSATPQRHGVKVSCRFRAATSDRKLDLLIDADTVSIGTAPQPGDRPATASTNSNNNSISHPSHHQATFDHIYGPETTQTEIFNQIGYCSVQDVLQGYNCTILTYGQTGSGKKVIMTKK